ncbi:MAG TPA: ABC transporter permease [Blastocatellia bacterium]|nr:ABC transporter permease [Blastocatellia bacterium]
MDKLIRDLRYALRILSKNRAFTMVAVLALGLGIGANTAIFSVVNAVLLRPLPYMDPQRLVSIGSGDKQAPPADFGGVSPADFWDWQQQSQAFEQLVAISGGGFALTGVEIPETFPGARVSTNLFEALHAKPLLGRTFRPDDGSLKSPDTIVLSYRLWQQRFGGDPSIVGQTLGDTGAEVIGVMPADFKWPVTAECWIPFSRDSGEMRNRANRYFGVVGLVREDQTLDSATAELQTIADNLAAQYPDTNKNITVAVVPFREALVQSVRPTLLVLLGAVAFVLLIACANVAGILLARAAARHKEIAIRLALGASRWTIIRQLLTESVLLGLSGAAVGLMLALWGVDLLVKLLPPSYAYLRLEDHVRIDGRVLLFTLLTALVTSLLFGLGPAWQSSRPSVSDSLKEGGRTSEGLRQHRTRSALVIAEIALAMVLLVGAGLLIQSFARLRQADLGFDPHNLVGMSINSPIQKYPDEQSRARFIKQFVDAVSDKPGVESVAVSTGLPFPFLNFTFNIEGRPLAADASAVYDSVSPNYFRTMKVRLLEGREFSDLDNIGTPPVAMINETLARRYFPGEDALGKRISINYLRTRKTPEIVGVVKDVTQGQLGKVQPQIYVPYQQQPWLSESLLVRAMGDPEAVKNDVQRVIWSVDKNQPVSRVDSPERALGNSLGEPRLYMTLLGVFAALALVLAAVGVYGVIAYSVAQRTHEIGIRTALGAQPRDVLALVLGQATKMIVAGVALGAVGAFALTRVLAGLLFNVSATDPVTFVSVAVLLTGVALLACYVPARRALRVDPMVALRCE